MSAARRARKRRAGVFKKFFAVVLPLVFEPLSRPQPCSCPFSSCFLLLVFEPLGKAARNRTQSPQEEKMEELLT